jgi:hypothetical protein
MGYCERAPKKLGRHISPRARAKVAADDRLEAVLGKTRRTEF